MSEHDRERFIVVGVTPSQPPRVLQFAARFARRFDAVMVCASVDPSSYVVVEHPDGSVEAQPINPDLVNWTSRRFDEALANRIRAVAREEQVQVVFRQLAGDIAHALGRLGDLLEAEMIVVGSRRAGIRATMHDFLGGSVAAHLAHRQHRPVVVIPLSPVPAGDRLPWEGVGS